MLGTSLQMNNTNLVILASSVYTGWSESSVLRIAKPDCKRPEVMNVFHASNLPYSRIAWLAFLQICLFGLLVNNNNNYDFYNDFDFFDNLDDFDNFDKLDEIDIG
jgi:hypothetical protein